MRTSVVRIWTVATTELRGALRNRRAIVVTLLFVAVAVLTMYGTVSLFSAMEREILSGLGLPASDEPGSVTTALWKSTAFSRTIGRMVGDNLVFADILGRHPMALAYAFFVFQTVPLLTLLVSAPRVADDLRSGAARYWLVRVTRTEWSLGKFFGEAMLLACAMTVGTVAAGAVASIRLPGLAGVRLFPELVGWAVRAWIYALAWLGLFLGVSHFARSGGKATALGILVLLGAAAWGPMLGNFSDALPYLGHLEAFVPQAAQSCLWRRSASALFLGVVHLAALSLFYLGLGAAVFRRRDV